MRWLKTVEMLLVRAMEWAVIVLIVALVLNVLWQVATRFLLGDPSKWTVELARYLMMWLASFGAAVGFARREHLGLDYFKQKLDPLSQRLLEILGQLAIIVFSVWILLGGGWKLASEVLSSGQLTAALGVPMGAVYMAIPIAGACILVISVVELLEILLVKSASDDGTQQEPNSPRKDTA